MTPTTGDSGSRTDGGEDLHGGPFSPAQILRLMKAEFGRARRHGTPLAVLTIAVDRLQALTQIHGDRLRELVRRELTGLLSARTREYDLVGVLRDDVLLVVLPQTDAAGARTVAERIRAGFDQLEVRIGKDRIPLTLSCGFASSSDRETMFHDTLVAQAEKALDEARRAGGDRIATSRD